MFSSELARLFEMLFGLVLCTCSTFVITLRLRFFFVRSSLKDFSQLRVSLSLLMLSKPKQFLSIASVALLRLMLFA